MKMYSAVTVFCLSANLVSFAQLGSPQRHKRYLAFPNKASVALTISLLKGIANDIKVGPTVKVVTIHELDVLFPLPHEPSPFELAQAALGQPPIFHSHSSHRRHRRHLYSQLQELFYLQGLDGASCLMKALCEAENQPTTTEENLLQELLTVIFSYPQNVTLDDGELYLRNEGDCQQYRRLCPFSIFDLAVDRSQPFSNLHNTNAY